MKKVCVLGNFSGRNAGDAAILEGLLNDVYPLNRKVEFVIPTINKSFVEKTYASFPVRAVPLMPWNCSLKIFGLPTLRSVLDSDLVLVTDAILFDRKLLNPLYNYLSTMSLVLPMAAKKGIPVVLYNVSLGPVTTGLGRKCMQRVLDGSRHVIVRDRESIEMLVKQKLVANNLEIGADCALNIAPISKERLEEIKRDKRVLDEKGRYVSFNVSSYLDVFVRPVNNHMGTEHFIDIIVETMDRIVGEMKKRIVFVITQPMDLKIARRILAKLEYQRDVTLISNKEYSHRDLAGVLSQVELHVGMRTHSLILATSASTPTVGIIATPKNRGYMRSIEQEERMIEFGEGFSANNLYTLIRKTWSDRDAVKERLDAVMPREKSKARMSAQFLREYLN